ncbi:MFS transporter [Pontibacillus salipaludis]|uniref:MFS transporter n=1 Tax=Pontibacillus salipaludis TaxID=1697394 RepID=A0ABQ1QES0_9BACI|nr:MFS transporter [Pontibacillus salipaludis]GGD24304.1 MFS transporter [Pontibacillus salipaludis]
MTSTSHFSYRRLFVAGIINGIGDRFNQVAVLAMILSLTGSGVAVGGALAIRIVPYLLFSPIGGWLATVVSLRRIMVGTDLVRIFFALSLLLVENRQDLWIVYAILFLLAASEAVYQPVRRTYISRYIKREDMLTVNKLEQVLLGFVLILGSAGGGVVSYLFSPQLVFIVNAFTFLVAALILLQVYEEKSKFISSKQAVYTVIQKGFGITLRSPLLRRIFFIDVFISMADGIFNVLISVYAYQRFQTGGVGIGIFYGALGVGLVLSMWVPVARFKYLMPVAVGALLTEGVFQVFLSQANGFYYAILLFMLISLSGGVGKGAMDTMVMKQLSNEQESAVYSLFDMVTNVVMGLSMFGTGLLLTYYSPTTLGVLAGILFIGVATIGGYAVYRKQELQKGSVNEMNDLR